MWDGGKGALPRKRRVTLGVAVVLMVLGALVMAAGCAPSISGNWAPRTETVMGLTRIARTEGQQLLLSTQGGVVDFLAGVESRLDRSGYPARGVGRHRRGL